MYPSVTQPAHRHRVRFVQYRAICRSLKRFVNVDTSASAYIRSSLALRTFTQQPRNKRPSPIASTVSSLHLLRPLTYRRSLQRLRAALQGRASGYRCAFHLVHLSMSSAKMIPRQNPGESSITNTQFGIRLSAIHHTGFTNGRTA